MDRFHNIAGGSAHFDGQDRFGDQVAGGITHYAAAENALAQGIDDPFRQALGPTDGLGAAAGAPGEKGRRNRAGLLLGLPGSDRPPT